MADLVLTLVIVVLLVERVWSNRETTRKERRLFNMIQARNASEYAILQRVDQTPIVKKEPTPQGEPTIPVGL